MNRWWLRLTLGICVGILCYFLYYLCIISSRSYSIAYKIANDSPTVIEKTGGIRDISLSLWDSTLSESPSSGAATLDLRVLGEKQNGKVVVRLRKRAGDWAVVSAFLNGAPLQAALAPQDPLIQPSALQPISRRQKPSGQSMASTAR
jgi:hypothetical protein